MAKQQMSQQDLVAQVTAAVMAALKQASTGATTGTAQTAVITPRQTRQEVRYFTALPDKRNGGALKPARATKQGDLSLEGHPCAEGQERTEAFALNTGLGQFGMERVMAPRNAATTMLLDALHADGAIITVTVQANGKTLKVNLVRNQGIAG